jgi:hypothetical protein
MRKIFVLRADNQLRFNEFLNARGRINETCSMLCNDLTGCGIDAEEYGPGYFAIINFKPLHETMLYMLASEYEGLYIQEFYTHEAHNE